ncbi:MAG TPA: hypothetical protein VGY53_06310, partial [Isosphaeraceae bacterium]|nr:hypothetical protein [Isosphaeraceae bacterium]
MEGVPTDPEPGAQEVPPGSPQPARKRLWVRALKAIVAVVVLYAVARHVMRTWADLQSQGRVLHVEPVWIAASVALYLLGLCLFGVFFWRILRCSATPIGLAPALRAYVISHLGKYVPGKAMVVVMRAGLVVPQGARMATAAFATLYETLVMMAAGGLMAAVGFWLKPVEPFRLKLGSGFTVVIAPSWLSLLLGLVFLAVAAPAVFPRLLAWVTLPFPGVGSDALPRFSVALLGFGLVCSWAGWLLLGLSQVAVVRAIEPAGVAMGQWPLVVASV